MCWIGVRVNGDCITEWTRSSPFNSLAHYYPVPNPRLLDSQQIVPDPGREEEKFDSEEGRINKKVSRDVRWVNFGVRGK